MSDWTKFLLIILLVLIWDSTIILFREYRNNSNKYKEDTNIEVIDTVIDNKPKFFSQTPQEGLKEALEYYDIAHKDIVYAQAILETGHFTSNLCVNHNNLFGLYDSNAKEYSKFNHWSESVIAYKNWIQYKYEPTQDYYAFLEEINYASDKKYTKRLKQILKQD